MTNFYKVEELYTEEYTGVIVGMKDFYFTTINDANNKVLELDNIYNDNMDSFERHCVVIECKFEV